MQNFLVPAKPVVKPGCWIVGLIRRRTTGCNVAPTRSTQKEPGWHFLIYANCLIPVPKKWRRFTALPIAFIRTIRRLLSFMNLCTSPGISRDQGLSAKAALTFYTTRINFSSLPNGGAIQLFVTLLSSVSKRRKTVHPLPRRGRSILP